MSYKSKYLKYKNKYLELKKISGGAVQVNKIKCSDEIAFNNTLGTCWNNTILMILFFGDGLSDTFQNYLMTRSVNLEPTNRLLEYLPEYLFNNYTYSEGLKDDVKIKINKFCNSLIDRFDIKNYEYNQSPKSETTDLTSQILRRKSKICSGVMTYDFKNIFMHKEYDKDSNAIKRLNDIGGINSENFFLMIILCICFYDKMLNMQIIELNKSININNVEQSYGIIINSLKHVACFYKCNGDYKFYNNGKIINYNGIKLFELLNDLTRNKKEYTLYFDKYVGPICVYKTEIYNTARYYSNEYDLFLETTLEKDKLKDISSLMITNFKLISNNLFTSPNEFKYINSIDYLDNIIRYDNINILLNSYNINVLNNNGNTPLLLALMNNNTDLALRILELEPDVNIADKNGYTPLLIAIYQNNTEVALKILELKSKPDVNIADKNGNIPLLIAIYQNNTEVALKILELKSKPDINIIDKNGKTPLILAIDKHNTKVALKILELNPDVNMADRDGFTPLLIAIDEKNTEVALKILDHRPNVNKTDANGESPLLFALINNNINVALKILELKPDVNIIDNNGLSPLSLAIYMNNTEVALKILELKPDVNIFYNKSKYNPLKLAIDKGNIPVVLKILEYIPKLTKSAYDYAQYIGNKIITEKLNSLLQKK